MQMTEKLLDGKAIAATIKKEIAKEVAALIDADMKAPHLAAILVGNDPASETYVASKEKACLEVGITSTTYRLPEKTSENELLEVIRFLNNDPEVDVFIVQLPAQINTDRIIEAIDPAKDVDGFHPVNMGRMQSGLTAYLPATPFGVVELLRRSKVTLEGKHCVVIGRSNIVGTPLSILLSRKNVNATVTLCHSKTADLKSITSQADVLIAAIGQVEFVTKDMVKPGAVVVDVGIHRVEDTSSEKGYHLAGDVDFKNVSKVASRITPVPGGVGPMTIVSLLNNTLLACKKQVYKN
ncbi:MAG TPA: bifunctional 5,10-methylenetetrahydrofolate dehydrogenase/5,10-methenyltetrahydrofolate cyclohydrolase [Bacteroidales bacterium]|nr:bifunctional 5,10-methylenetetrahydrofolate dehydrogenase/5,10-methenyltetrahydrofolate cyclohydrolase [Bacteroidales bacterium]